MNRLKDFTIALAGTIVRVALVILAIIYIMKFAGKAYDFGYRIFAEEPMSAPPGRDVTVTVTDSDAQADIIQMLEDKGLIRDHTLFTIQKKLSIYKDDIDPGSYVLNTCMTTDEMLEILVGTDEDSESSEPDELTEEIDPSTDDITGLETGGVLSEEGSYDESVAFEEEMTEAEDDGTAGEFEGEGDEESAIEE